MGGSGGVAPRRNCPRGPRARPHERRLIYARARDVSTVLISAATWPPRGDCCFSGARHGGVVLLGLSALLMANVALKAGAEGGTGWEWR